MISAYPQKGSVIFGIPGPDCIQCMGEPDHSSAVLRVTGDSPGGEEGSLGMPSELGEAERSSGGKTA